MARKKPARPAAKRAKKKAAPSGARARAAKQAVRNAAKTAGRAAKTARSSARKAAKTARSSAKKAVSKARTIVRAAAKTKTGKAASAAVGRAAKVAASTRPGKIVKRAVVNVRAVKAGVVAALTPPAGKKANIDRPRKTVADIHGTPSSLDMGSLSSAARSGRAELKGRMRKNTSASPALTAGDVDADWQSAETVGDEAPGGDNPTPDQDVVDDIGRALGVEYQDNEELKGSDKIAERDKRRWELDPASAEDYKDRG